MRIITLFLALSLIGCEEYKSKNPPVDNTKIDKELAELQRGMEELAGIVPKSFERQDQPRIPRNWDIPRPRPTRYTPPAKTVTPVKRVGTQQKEGELRKAKSELKRIGMRITATESRIAQEKKNISRARLNHKKNMRNLKRSLSKWQKSQREKVVKKQSGHLSKSANANIRAARKRLIGLEKKLKKLKRQRGDKRYQVAVLKDEVDRLKN